MGGRSFAQIANENYQNELFPIQALCSLHIYGTERDETGWRNGRKKKTNPYIHICTIYIIYVALKFL